MLHCQISNLLRCPITWPKKCIGMEPIQESCDYSISGENEIKKVHFKGVNRK